MNPRLSVRDPSCHRTPPAGSTPTAGASHFGRLSAPRAHTKAPYKTDSHRRTLTGRVTAFRAGAGHGRRRDVQGGGVVHGERVVAREAERKVVQPRDPVRVHRLPAELVPAQVLAVAVQRPCPAGPETAVFGA